MLDDTDSGKWQSMLNAMHTGIAIATHSPGDLVLKFGYVGDVELDQELELGISGTFLVVLVQLLAQGFPPVHPAHVVALAWILEAKVVNLQIDAWQPQGGRNRHRTGSRMPFKENCYTSFPSQIATHFHTRVP